MQPLSELRRTSLVSLPYLSPDSQNEMLKIMAQASLRMIVNNLQSSEFIAVMMDECTDSTNREQVS